MEQQVETEFITLTPAAIEVVRQLLEKNNVPDHALRVFVSGSGCSGIQYGLALEGNIRPQDFSLEMDGLTVVIDEVSIEYLRGASIDYVELPTGGGFKIENPNIISCGCSSASSSEDGGCSGCN